MVVSTLSSSATPTDPLSVYVYPLETGHKRVATLLMHLMERELRHIGGSGLPLKEERRGEHAAVSLHSGAPA